MNTKFLSDFSNGNSITAYKYLGAHFVKQSGVDGILFSVYAPHALEVQVVGEFNKWNGAQHNMKRLEGGIYQLFVPNLKDYDCYKYRIRGSNNLWFDKADPFAYFSQFRPETASKIYNLEGFPWNDTKWMTDRSKNYNKPMSVYELHFGSWQKKPNGDYHSYEELVEYLIPYILNQGFTHIELMPLLEHPFDGSWGYLCTGYFNVTSRYGNPKQLMYFIDKCHQAGIGVIIDYVPVHFVKDDFGLHLFDGEPLYEYPEMSNRYSEWGSVNFNLGKEEVRSFLMSSAAFWLEYFHFDGIRVDAVSNIIFWAGNSEKGINYGALDFIKRFNYQLAKNFPEVMLIAEDSSAYQGVTKPTFEGGLGFDYKWDLGWMNDTLKYYKLDPIYRKFHHHQLTFSMHYFFSERFLLPLSHDEVVHLKGSIINKMWGSYEDKFAQARNLMTYMFMHPGKKLNFMGNEFATFEEWNEDKELNWSLYQFPKHQGFARLIKDLNEVYKYYPALYLEEYDPKSFMWLMPDNANQSIFIFARQIEKAKFIVFLNMTPVYYDFYEFGVPWPGEYREIINSAKEVYGGFGPWNGEQLITDKEPLHNHNQRLAIKVASFSAIVLLHETKKQTENKNMKGRKKSA